MARGDWLVDKKELLEKLCISKDFFYNYIANDPRMLAIKIGNNRKNWWPTEEAKKICIEIMNEYE